MDKNITPNDAAEIRKARANSIIKDYAFRSSLTGLIPIPGVDMIGLIGVQRLMLLRLSRLYGVPFKKNLASISLSTLTSGVAVRTATPLLGSMFKLIPGIGTLAGGASVAALSSASTYAVGRVFQQHYENGGTLEDFNPEEVKEHFEEQLVKATEESNNENDER